jgi:WD40 repeat protein
MCKVRSGIIVASVNGMIQRVLTHAILSIQFDSLQRYDASGKDIVATGSVDSTVKVWDSSNGSLLATLRGGSSNAIISCDISNGVVVGAGSDKTCRVWNMRTQRMVSLLNSSRLSFLCCWLNPPGRFISLLGIRKKLLALSSLDQKRVL